MPLLISDQLRRSLPSDEREGLEEYLWKKSGGKCFLCRGEMNLAAETLVADHDVPTASKGKPSRTNLNVAHHSCNSFKREQATLDVRPFLQLRRVIEDLGGLVNYGDLVGPLGISVGPTTWNEKTGSMAFQFSDGSKDRARIHSERQGKRTYRYVFVEVPRQAIHNDNECQPRNIKVSQLWKIFLDIQRNPLHEPPSVRLIGGDAASGGGRLVLFDGQHKTLACWLDGRSRVLTKVYLDLTTAETIQLVNSIQASIPKLPLSTFELTAKMDEETRFKLERYLKEKDAEATEAGFLHWLPSAERARGRQGFGLALVNGFIQSTELRLLHFVQRAGSGKSKELPQITETAFKAKVLERLIHRQPLTESWIESAGLRERERTTIVRLLNLLTEYGLDVDPTDAVAVESRKRMLYQSSLGHLASILRRTVGLIVRSSENREFIEKEPTEEQWQEIAAAVRLLVDHPIWTTDLNSTDKTRAVRDALSKNQDAEKAFRDIGLTPGYLLGDKLSPTWDG